MPYKDPEVRRQKRREWYARTKEIRQEYFREYAQLPKQVTYNRLRALKRYYNLEAEEYLQMILDQNNLCAICNKPETCRTKAGDVRPLTVDHCHSKGHVRGLLCNHCNSMLGQARDNVDTLQKAIEYLKNDWEKSS